MKPITNKIAYLKTRLLLPALAAVASLAPMAHAAAPGITGGSGSPTFNLDAQPAYLTQPDGQSIYSWGYGCSSAPAGFMPSTFSKTGTCGTMQVPGPTLIVKEGDVVTVNLLNNLPAAAGNTSILFPGFQVCIGTISDPVSGACTSNAGSNGVAGLLTQEAANGATVSYSFVANTPGTHSYYSGTQGDLQIEMGLYGAIIVLPKTPGGTAGCDPLRADSKTVESNFGEADYTLSSAAFDIPQSCYDREYLFQFSEMDPRIHSAALAQVNDPARAASCKTSSTDPACRLSVPTEPYHPAYFMINGRSMPDDMDPNYADEYPHQPYNGNPHMHPGEMVLLRIIGQGRWQHPFHEHANHVRILARDGNLILAPDGKGLAGPPLFTTTTTPGMTLDGLFYYTGRGLNWDMYAHTPTATGDPLAILPCTPDANGYNTGYDSNGKATLQIGAVQHSVNYYEWCADHNKPLQGKPFGDVASGGPATLPDANILTNGAWYGGSPYLGPDATTRATGCVATGTAQSNAPNCGNTGVTPPSGTIANSPSGEAGFAFMWHSHNEREITTNNAFPGGMMMMMLVDSREFLIDETN